MAYIYKKMITAIDKKTGQKKRSESKKWWIKYRNGQGLISRVPGCTDKSATQKMATKLEQQAERQRNGIGDPYEQHRGRTLLEHLDDFEEFLTAKGDTESHVKQVKWRAKQILAGCEFVVATDISASRVQKYLADLRKTQPEDRQLRHHGRSAQTANHYLRALKQFFAWMVRERRLPDNPLTCITQFNVKRDRRHDRRVPSWDEFTRLLAAAVNGPEIEGVIGPDRAIIYQLAVATGFRRKELASLRLESFELLGNAPVVALSAEFTKNGRDARIPLHSEVALSVRAWISERQLAPKALMFPLRTRSGKLRRTSKMIERDLKSARQDWINQAENDADRRSREESSFLRFCDSAGLFVDFHAMRHSFVTSIGRLADSRTTQQLARHSSFQQTNNYMHSGMEQQEEAIRALPVPALPQKSSEGTQPERRRNRKSVVLTVVPTGAQNGAEQLSLKQQHLAANGNTANVEAPAASTYALGRKVNEPKTFGLPCHQTTTPGTVAGRASEEVHPSGLEPLTFGSVDRCSIQLS